MNSVLRGLRALGEPTRLRIVALACRSAFCVTELVDILGQSQPRLSRHLKLLCDAGVVERVREGANVWFGLPAEHGLVDEILSRVPADDPILAADRRAAARVLSERARVASEAFHRAGADWDEMRALDLPAEAVEAALLAMLPARIGRALDVGTGTGRMLELLAPRIESGLGVDASRAMLALARARLARPGLAHLAVRHADMYALKLPARFDFVVLHMVLHHAEDPATALAEAARVLRAGGRLAVVDLASHGARAATERLAHRWPGFDDETMRRMLADAGLTPGAIASVAGPLEIRIWTGVAPAVAAAVAAPELEFAQ